MKEMSQKKKAKSNAGDNTAVWNREEDPLQAVIIADSFNERFCPITKEKPRALLPLVNKVLLDYTIEYLIEEGVQEIFILGCAHADQVKEYVNRRKASWLKKRSQCHIQTIISSSSECISLGDALREIDREGLIRSDFLLVPGDLVSNIKLAEIVEEHKIRRKKEKTSLMTMLYKVANPGHFSRCIEEDVVLAVDPSTKRVLYCHKVQQNNKFSIPLGLFSDRKSVQLRYDLSDCHIWICSPTVLPLFTDNFDYQSKEDFVRGIFVNEEIMGNQIHCHTVEDEYAARISDLHMYNAVSLDIINRWTYPQVPDSGTYNYGRHNVYCDQGVKLSRDCTFEEDVVIGKDSTIGTGTFITKSVIGVNCNIGNNVRIINSFIWDNVSIEDDSLIEYSIICDGCQIKRAVTMQDALISFNVSLGPNLNVEPGSRFSLLEPDILDDLLEEMSIGEEKPPESRRGVVGFEGRGYLWPAEEDEEFLPILREERHISEAEESSEDESITSRTSSPPPEAGMLFYSEVLENIRHGVQDNISSDHIVLEVNASKYKYNVSIKEINQAISKGLLEVVLEDTSKSNKELVQYLEKVLSAKKSLVSNYIKDQESQMDAITAAEDLFAMKPDLAAIFPTFLHKLYDKDILEESVILDWFKTPPFVEDFALEENYKKLRTHQVMGRFITWLQEAEVESDSESEESD